MCTRTNQSVRIRMQLRVFGAAVEVKIIEAAIRMGF